MYAWNERGPADQLTYCIDLNNPKNSTASEGFFASVFPTSCPWITSVGGTQFLPVVSNGSSSTTASSGVPSSSSFPTRRAWDAVAGLGTPDFEKLKELYLGLP